MLSRKYFGTLLPSIGTRRFSRDFRLRMPMVFGCIALGLSAALVVKAKYLAPVVLAVILGTIIGEVLPLESWIQKGAGYIRDFFEKNKGDAAGGGVSRSFSINSFI